MTLGVYWYFDFPTSIYKYDFFEFHKGLGGHGNLPAGLKATVEIDSIDAFLSELEDIIYENEGSEVYMTKYGNTIEIEIFAYQFFDFEFELGLRIESLLKSHKATQLNLNTSQEKEIIRLKYKTENDYKGLRTKILQIVGSPIRHAGAETASIRFDCNIHKNKLKTVCEKLTVICDKHGIDVLYYLRREVGDRLNLMFLLTNGRQGVNLKQKKQINLRALELSISEMVTQLNINTGFIKGYDNYPNGEPITLKIIDEEFVF